MLLPLHNPSPVYASLRLCLLDSFNFVNNAVVYILLRLTFFPLWSHHLCDIYINAPSARLRSLPLINRIAGKRWKHLKTQLTVLIVAKELVYTGPVLRQSQALEKDSQQPLSLHPPFDLDSAFTIHDFHRSDEISPTICSSHDSQALHAHHYWPYSLSTLFNSMSMIKVRHEEGNIRMRQHLIPTRRIHQERR